MAQTEFYTSLRQEEIDIRTTVFVDEQGFNEEFDTIDSDCIHAIIYVDGKAAGCARMFKDENSNGYHIGRVAILKEYRKLHLGSEIMNAMIEKAKALGGDTAIVSAQCRVQGFYESLGFEASGDIYLDEHCPHIHMEKKL